ncbi:helix-turn-helix domain-containing protein [Marisediminicola sp. LYQ134]|uniref:helix-turn-helix domain-containing protein n=1 Tax=Marisediminicola sp. LYQ134 TaxID=3391061 RepID=UPI003983BEBF
MASRSSAVRDRRIAELGAHVSAWRKASRITADLLAQRAGITRDTLRAIETGSGSVKVENLFAVLEALGLDAAVVRATDPTGDDRGRALLERGLPTRVRS